MCTYIGIYICRYIYRERYVMVFLMHPSPYTHPPSLHDIQLPRVVIIHTNTHTCAHVSMPIAVCTYEYLMYLHRCISYVIYWKSTHYIYIIVYKILYIILYYLYMHLYIYKHHCSILILYDTV